jgi:uncharacterized protein
VSGLPVSICSACRQVVFPARVLCPRCGGSDWETGEVDEGVLEDVTAVRRVPGGELPEPIQLGAVRITGGPVVVARLEPGADPGTPVSVEYLDGIPIARNRTP